MTEKVLDMLFDEEHYIVIEEKGAKTMNTDNYTKMVEDGRDIISVLNSAPEDKRFLVSAIAEAFLNGLNTGEKLAQAKRPGA